MQNLLNNLSKHLSQFWCIICEKVGVVHNQVKPIILSHHFSIWMFILTSSTTCGIVFFGALVGIGYMLSELGFAVADISTILLGALPYSFKFVISPLIKNFIIQHKNRCKIIKKTSILLQIITFIGIYFWGTYTKESSVIIIFLNIFIVTLACSINDLLSDYIRLRSFTGKEIGVITSVGGIGFKLGMFLSSVCTLYIANFYSWHMAFVIVGSFIFFNTVSAIFLKFDDNSLGAIDVITTIPKYLTFYKKLIIKYGVLSMFFIPLIFKFSDSCVNGLKVVFLNTLGVDKISFANLSQFLGVIVMIITGIIAGICVYRFGTKKCIFLAFFSEIIACLCFILLSIYHVNLVIIAILINIATFFLGFSSMIYRTYISEAANGDINSYTVLLSIGSLFRSISFYIGGILVDFTSWTILYVFCAIFTVIGLIIVYKNPVKCVA